MSDDFGLKIDARGIAKMERDLVKWGMATSRDLSAVNRSIKDIVKADAKLHAPIGHGSSKDSRTHARPGAIQRMIGGTASKFAATLTANDRVGHFYLQEFGGISFWHRGGRGVLRSAGSRQKGIMGAARATKTRGHVIYRKARTSNNDGHFFSSAPKRKAAEIIDEFDRFFKQAFHKTMRGSL